MGDASDPLFRGGGLLVGEPSFLGALRRSFMPKIAKPLLPWRSKG